MKSSMDLFCLFLCYIDYHGGYKLKKQAIRTWNDRLSRKQNKTLDYEFKYTNLTEYVSLTKSYLKSVSMKQNPL